MATASTRTIIISAVAVCVAAGIGYWGYGAYKKRELNTAVTGMLKNAGARVRDGLNIESGPPPTDRAETAKKLEAAAAATQNDFSEMRRMAVERDRLLTDNAESYLIHVREMLLKQAASQRSYQLHTQSALVLGEHMQRDNRTGTWVSQAVAIKDKAEKDFRDYRIATTAYSALLKSFPQAQRKIAPYTAPADLVDDQLVEKAGARSAETLQRAEAEMEKLRKMVGPR